MANETIKINGSEYAPRVIFDNGGGITIQLPDFAHTYDDAEQVAYDVKLWILDGDTSNWDGNEPEAMRCDPTGDEIRNGGYDIWAIGDDVSEDDRMWGSHTCAFFGALMPYIIHFGDTIWEKDTVEEAADAVKALYNRAIDEDMDGSASRPEFNYVNDLSELREEIAAYESKANGYFDHKMIVGIQELPDAD